MKDTMKDFGKMIQDQKPSGNDVKCAEIKTLSTGTHGLGKDKQLGFKVGEYNRATATFEMNSVEESKRIPETKPKFDFSSETGPCHYFKSLFARSMVVNNNSSDKCKSMDYAVMSRNSRRFCKGESPGPVSNLNGDRKDGGDNSRSNSRSKLWMMPGKDNWDLRRAHLAEVGNDDFSSGTLIGDQPPSSKVRGLIVHGRHI
ncbi:hypothetical protein RUM43_003054 [Polyplax serrata]|uniref:Uncharacterized protein n=1 Tax=Polyplax serrata TaxID=468196 RepID=A0AAN8PET5_POLSC